MSTKNLTDEGYKSLADTYLMVIYNNLIGKTFKSFAEFLNAVFTDKITGETYLDDRISLGVAINDYLSIIWKTKSGLETKMKDLAKAAGSGKFPTKSAIWMALSKDVSSISPLEYVKATVAGTKKAAQVASKNVSVIADAGFTGLTSILRNAPIILGVFGAGLVAFFVYKAKKIAK